MQKANISTKNYIVYQALKRRSRCSQLYIIQSFFAELAQKKTPGAPVSSLFGWQPVESCASGLKTVDPARGASRGSNRPVGQCIDRSAGMQISIRLHYRNSLRACMREYPTSVSEQHEEHIKNLNPLYHIFEIALKFGQMYKARRFSSQSQMP